MTYERMPPDERTKLDNDIRDDPGNNGWNTGQAQSPGQPEMPDSEVSAKGNLPDPNLPRGGMFNITAAQFWSAVDNVEFGTCSETDRQYCIGIGSAVEIILEKEDRTPTNAAKSINKIFDDTKPKTKAALEEVTGRTQSYFQSIKLKDWDGRDWAPTHQDIAASRRSIKAAQTRGR